jgi:predicted ester cyclase
MNLEQFIQYNAAIFTAFPDTYFTIDDMIVKGDKVVTRYTMNGTFKKEYKGIAPTGKEISIKGVSIDRISKGRAVETWDYPDMLSVMIQLGIIPDLSSRI